MGSTPTVPSAKDEELALRMRAERDRLARALGLDRQPQHYRRPAERPFAPAERGTGVTLLFGGLTRRHELLIKAAMAGLGHDADALPCPDVRAFQTGKEYGNPGQCNPNYFTVGSLVRHLQELEQAGASRDEIVDRFVMVTGGACGPCRFGMYEAEYRLALRNSGFDGFRVALFDNAAGLEQGVAESGISFDAEFFLSLLYALIVGDLLNDVAYQIRPFEVSPGQTDQVLDEAVERLGDVFATPRLPSGRLKSAIDGVGGRWPPGRQATAIAARLRDRRLAHVLSDVHTMLGRIEVDRTRLRPIVKVTGEFWAQTTEGDGNFGMFRFLEGEGAQVIVEPVGTWITYLLHQAKQRSVDRKASAPAGPCAGTPTSSAAPPTRPACAGRTPRSTSPRRSSGANGNATAAPSAACRTRSSTSTSSRGWPTRTTTHVPLAARATSRSPRTSTTRRPAAATWCCRSSHSGACHRPSPTRCSRR
jgi:hypothetical protein